MPSKIEKQINIKVTQTGTKDLKATSAAVKTLLTNLDALNRKFKTSGRPLANIADSITRINNSVKAGTNDFKDYQKSIDSAAKSYEKLSKKSKEATGSGIKFPQSSRRPTRQNRSEKDAAAADTNLKVLRGQLSQEARERQAQAESLQFWSQDVWRGQNPLTNIWDRYKPTSRLQRRIADRSKQEAEALAQNRASRETIARLEGIKRTRKLTKNESEALVIAQGEAAASKAAASTASASVKSASATLGVLMAIGKLAKQFFAGWKVAVKAVTGMSFSVRENFADVMNRVAAITDMYSGAATYASGSSLIMNSAARETQMRYGLTGGQAYAFTKTRDLLGIKSDEDLAYMNADQRALFQTYMQKQEQWYTKLEQSGALRNIQEMQLDFAMMKEQLANEFLGWVAENKDTIMWALKTGLSVLKALLTGVMKILTFFRMDTSDMAITTESATLSDRISASQVSTVNNRNVNINSTFNASGVISSQDALQDWYETQAAQLYRTTAPEIGG